MDLLVQIRDKDAAPAFRKIAQDPSADETVRQRAAAGLQKLGGTQ